MITYHYSVVYKLYTTYCLYKKTLGFPRALFFCILPYKYKVAGIYGGSDEDRTRYLLHAMEALFQVSYRPISTIYNN